MTTSRTWTYTSSQEQELSRSTQASRDLTCFAVLDFDSLTTVRLDDRAYDVTALIYKKTRIIHNQSKVFEIEGINTDPLNAIKFFAVPSVPISPETAGKDNFVYSGSRQNEYWLCVVKEDVEAHAYNLFKEKLGVDLDAGLSGDLVTGVSGSYEVNATWADFLTALGPMEDQANIDGPNHTITGRRLNGVSIYVGEEYVVYSYDEESFEGTPTAAFDAAVAFEDCDDGWVKVARVVGLVDIKTLSIVDTKRYDCAQFDGKVYACAYTDTR